MRKCVTVARLVRLEDTVSIMYIAYNRAYYIQPQARPLFPLMLSNRHRFVPCVSKLLTEPQKRKTNRSIKSIKRIV